MKKKQESVFVTESKELQKYSRPVWVGVLYLALILIGAVVNVVRIFLKDGVFQPYSVGDWIHLAAAIGLMGMFYYFGFKMKILPLWWERYIRRPSLFCRYNPEKKEYDFQITYDQQGKKELEKMAAHDGVIRAYLPLYGLLRFRWGNMVWFDGYQNRRLFLRFSLLDGVRKVKDDLRVDVRDDWGNCFTSLYFNRLPYLAIKNNQEGLSEIIPRLVMSQEQEEKTLKELSDLKDRDREKWSALMGIGTQAIKGLRTIVTSTRLNTSDEAGEAGERFGVILEYVKDAGEGFADKDVLKARAEWEASDVKKRLDRRRALKASDENEKLELERKHKRRRVARTKQ